MNTPAGVEVRHVDKRFGDVDVLHDVDLDVPGGSITALLGPSGCGKTTLLRIIAGLERPDAGEIAVAGRLLTGPAAFVPPEQRRVGMVFQDWALFPHLTVARNVGYGLGRRGPDHTRRVDEALELVGLPGLGARLPGTLSGGQQQRVALARALAPRPSVLLLDEPFSNLDTSLRVQVRAEVHTLLADLGITSVFVTHDQDEAFVLGGHVAVMHGGRIVQSAAPAELYAHPATPWVAEFVGDANLLAGDGSGTHATTALGQVPLAEPAHGPLRVLVRPESVALAPANGTGGDGVVEVLEYYGHDCVYLVRTDAGAEVRVRAGSAPIARRGDRVGVRYAGGPAVAFP
jgi:iron(III) transport system ATP-binding protein